MNCLSIYFQIVNILRYFCLWLMFLFVFPGELFDFEHGNCTAGAWKNRKKRIVSFWPTIMKNILYTTLACERQAPLLAHRRWDDREETSAVRRLTPYLITPFRVRYDHWIIEVKTHFISIWATYPQIPTRKRPVYYSAYCVYSNFKHLLAGISEYFTLRRG